MNIIVKQDQNYIRGKVSLVTIIKGQKTYPPLIPGVEILVDNKTVYKLSDLAILWTKQKRVSTTQ